MDNFFIDFFQNRIENRNGLKFDDILKYDDYQLEDKHNYIQYLFPLPIKSQYNPDAPVISQIFINEALNNEIIRKNIIKAFLRMMKFYGFNYISRPFSLVDRGEEKQWLTNNNHNYLRITRILKFLMLVKMELLTNVFVEQLCYLQPTGKIDDKSFNIWIKIIKVKE
jgi:hypothetical protein